tara:strand:- start:131 stop:406 length:276 start_codon:yes stop_codon:yes gene_type:complete
VVKDRNQPEGRTGSYEIKASGETSVLVSAVEPVRSDAASEYMKEHPDASREQLNGYLKTLQLSKTGTEVAEIKARQRVLKRIFSDGQDTDT